MPGTDAYAAIAELLHKSQVRSYPYQWWGLLLPTQAARGACMQSRIPEAASRLGLTHGRPPPVPYDAWESWIVEDHVWVGELC